MNTYKFILIIVNYIKQLDTLRHIIDKASITWTSKMDLNIYMFKFKLKNELIKCNNAVILIWGYGDELISFKKLRNIFYC